MNFGVGDRGGCGLLGHVWLAFDLSMPHLLHLSTDFILPLNGSAGVSCRAQSAPSNWEDSTHGPRPEVPAFIGQRMSRRVGTGSLRWRALDASSKEQPLISLTK